MKKVFILIFLVVTIIFSCKTDSNKENELLQKENELLKKELELEKRENKIDSENSKNTNQSETKSQQIESKPNKQDMLVSNITAFNELYANDQNTKIQYNGDFVLDMGSASAGRVAGNLKSLNLSYKHLPERPGCADICPEMIVIHFECKFGKKCLSDPAFPDSYRDSGSISIANISFGKKTFELLNKINKNLN